MFTNGFWIQLNARCLPAWGLSLIKMPTSCLILYLSQPQAEYKPKQDAARSQTPKIMIEETDYTQAREGCAGKDRPGCLRFEDIQRD